MKGNNLAEGRRTLAMIDRYPAPEEIYQTIMSTEWPYKKDKDFYVARDRALAALLYLIAIRISEAKRLTRQQFKLSPFRVEGIKLSKAEKHSKKTGKIIIRKDLYRKEARIPLHGERGKLGQLVLAYLKMMDLSFIPQSYYAEGNDEATTKMNLRLFPFTEKSTRIDQIIKNMLGIPPHWERAYGENYLYEIWDKDLLAVASYIQVDPRTLTKYIHGTHTKYLDREK
ncbi:MAG: hypothetical protein ABSF44_09725 [Candidatus Bathyarchaeia archaeon]|jgi:hypothetical protein